MSLMILEKILVFLSLFSLYNCYVVHEELEIDTSPRRLYQGDILLTEEQEKLLFSNATVSRRTGFLSPFAHWPRRGRFYVVPFLFHLNHYTPNEMQFIRKALRGIESVSCIKFVQRTYERDFVLVYSGPGCESRLGKIGGQQTISLNRQGCLKAEYMVQHEFMHALGFNHMQNHADRDQYIIVVKNNIDSRQLHNFEKVNHQYFSNYDTPYDYLSIMHYASNFFALDPSRPTIITKDPRYQSIIGKTQKLSEGDITRLNRMYPCS